MTTVTRMGEHPMKTALREQAELRKRAEAEEVDRVTRELELRIRQVGVERAIAEQLVKLRRK